MLIEFFCMNMNEFVVANCLFKIVNDQVTKFSMFIQSWDDFFYKLGIVFEHNA